MFRVEKDDRCGKKAHMIEAKEQCVLFSTWSRCIPGSRLCSWRRFLAGWVKIVKRQ